VPGLVGLALIASALTACSSGRAGSATGSTAPLTLPHAPTSKSVPTTTAPRSATAPRRATTTVRPVEGSDDVTPPPAIHATGTDYVAIARSLTTYRYWLLAHHPDAALASQIYVRGTATYQTVVSDLDRLLTNRQTLVSIDQQLAFTVASIRGSMMTLRVREVITEDRLLDRDHRVIGTKRFSEPNNYVVVMTRDVTGRWRLADVTRVSLDPTVIL
jgi:hypothetical protein